MTQSQTSAFSSFPYGGATNGLSIHEREREAARKERQLQNTESVSHSLQLFPQGPRKVQPSRSDRLQHNIQATLGDFNALAPSMSHQKQYSLLGITNKVPQTPVDAGNNKVFSFENNSTIKKENNVDKNAMKNQKTKLQNRTKDEKNRNDLKVTSNKKAVNTEQYLKSIKSNSKKTSDSDQNSKEMPQVKKASQEAKICTVKKESLCEVSKQEQQVQPTDEKITSIKKESKDTTIKHKPPKLSIKTRSPDHRLATTESTQANVKKILEEMTQPGPPPLTAIQTPRKNNAQFAFPLNPPASSLLNGSSPLTQSINKKEKEEQILKDLHISDDENTDDEANDSSDDSDSSSDSDSDSSSDNSPPNSPVRSKLNKPGKSCTPNHIDKQAAKTSQPASVTLASSTSSLGDTGEGGVRGDLAAPGAHTSPLNNPLLNADNPANGLSLFEDFGFDLPDISKTMLDEFGSCHDGDESGLIDPALLANDIDLCNKDPINHFKPIETPSEVKLKQPEVHSAKEVENRTKEDSEGKLSKQPKENHEKTSKSTNKRKASDSSKSNSKSNDSKDESKTKKVDKTSDRKVVKAKTMKGTKPSKPSVSDGENEEIDVVTVTDANNDKGLLNKSDTVDIKNNKTEESNKASSKTKTTEKLVNGHKEPSVNGHRNSLLNGHHKDTLLLEEKETVDGKLLSLSPKHGISEEITLDCNSKPDALVVKIPLALLKRIPLLKSINNKMEVETSPPRKPTKHQLSVECSDGKKPRYDHSTKSESKEGRRHSNSTYNDDYRRKRSPSRENDRYYNKRRRHDSDSSKREKENEKSVHSKMNGWDRLKDPKSPQEHNEVCSCGGKAEAEKRDAWISKLYDPEPRVPHGPDYYLHEAKRVKHRADAIKDHTSKAYKYFESVLNFVNCGKALEQNNDSESRSAYQMYLETVEMLKYAMRLSASKSSQEKKSDKRFIGLCLRLQSLLYMRLFKLKKDSMLKASKTLMDHFKGQPKNSQAPSPYNASNPKTTGTPSPMSPTPSPSGSIGSVGSVGSAGSNEAMTTPSRTNNKPSNCMTSPVNTCIPQKIHTMTVQHLGFTNHMLYGFDTWEQSQMIFNDYREFFMDLDRNYGPITLQSSIVDVVEYVHQGYLRIQESST